jgi:Trk K+ transport system NAD-binding subunit
MENIIFIVFRRMRAPLLALICAYSVAVLGLVLIPGKDAAGETWHMDVFHALYFVSYMATTIGFGEIPREFSEAQRMWVIFAIYLTVIVWVYAIGTLIALFQDQTFQQAVTERRFTRRIRRMTERFYLVCGYGQTGGALVDALAERDQQAVVVDIDPDRVRNLQLLNVRQYVPALCGDAGRPLHLLEAGLKHRLCAGVAALTNLNEVNLKIAITSKLLNPGITVICRADSHDIEANMASFGTDYIIDPFDTFAGHLSVALRTPCLYLLHEWLTGRRGDPLKEPVYPPRDGPWVVCGYGRFGKAVIDRLNAQDIETLVVEATPERTGTPEGGCVVGRGTEAETLREAEIGRAVGLVAGTDDDANNLSIVMTARELNPDLFVVVRQNLLENEEIVEAVHGDMVMHPSIIIANKIRVLLATPLLYEFEQLAGYQPDAWACQLVSRISALVSSSVPEIWELSLDAEQAFAVHGALAAGRRVVLGDLLADSLERERGLAAIPLLLLRAGERVLLPDEDSVLRRGDRLLFCGRPNARERMEWALQNQNALDYILTGESRPQGFIWRLLAPDRLRGD